MGCGLVTMMVRGRDLDFLVRILASSILNDSTASDPGSKKEARRGSSRLWGKGDSSAGACVGEVASFKASTVLGDMLITFDGAGIGDG